MNSGRFGSTDAAFFSDFFRDYKNRMEAVAPFEAGIEEEGIYFPGADDIRQKYEDYRKSGKGFYSTEARALVDAYVPYRDRVAQGLKDRGFPDIQSGLMDFERKTGVKEYSEPSNIKVFNYNKLLHDLYLNKKQKNYIYI